VELLTADTVRAAEGWMEAAEVNEGLYSVFDAEARQAELAVEKWNVRMTEWAAPSPERLRPLLEAYLAHEEITGHAHEPLSDLVETAARLAREHELSRMRPRWLARVTQRLRRQS